jgi:hypothetical protein
MKRKEKVDISTKVNGLVKSPPASLRGAKRRGNLLNIRAVMRLLRFARNDKSALFGLFTSVSGLTGKNEKRYNINKEEEK